MTPVINFVTVDFKVVQCHLSNLRKGRVALSNLRVKGPLFAHTWPKSVSLPVSSVLEGFEALSAYFVKAPFLRPTKCVAMAPEHQVHTCRNRQVSVAVTIPLNSPAISNLPKWSSMGIPTSLQLFQKVIIYTRITLN